MTTVLGWLPEPTTKRRAVAAERGSVSSISMSVHSYFFSVMYCRSMLVPSISTYPLKSSVENTEAFIQI